MSYEKLDVIIACIGVWILADSIASLYTYTGDGNKARGQSFIRDHLLRIVRGILGIILIVLGCNG